MNNLNIISDNRDKEERNIRKRLARKGYKLATTVNIPCGIHKTKLYAIVDKSTNFIVSSERMQLAEVDDWLNR